MEPWFILGAGAIGGLFAQQLSTHKIPVRLIDHQAVDSHTRTLTIQRENHAETSSFRVFNPSNPDNIQQLIITTKSHQTQLAIQPIESYVAKDARIIVFQNGLGSAEWLAMRFPHAKLFAATTTHGAYRKDRNTIIHAGQGTTWFGPLDPENAPLAEQIFNQWQQAGLEITYDANIEQRLWLKLAINCAINPLTVIYDCKNGQLLKIPEALNVMEKVLAEYEAVYRSKFGEQPTPHLLETVKEVAEKTANNISSMRQDILSGRETEISAINGYLVDQAERYNLPCEQNRALVNAILKLAHT